MKKSIFSAAAFSVAVVGAVSVAPTTSEAVPAFARQTGAACLNCHFQAIPRLTAFGRNFKMGAYRDMGDQALLEDDHLSLPAVFNASLLFKARIANNNTAVAGVAGAPGTGGAFNSGNSTALQWPDETALLIGGRYGEHIGGLTEWNGGPLSYKLAYIMDLESGILGFVGGSTDALGTAYLFQDPSNALVRNTRGSQFRPGFFAKTSVQQGVTGLGVYGYFNDMIYVALGQFVANAGVNPANGKIVAAGAKTNGAVADFMTWARLAITTEVAGMDTVLGVYSISGKQAKNAVAFAGAVTAKETTTGIDAQFQGDVGDDLSLGLYINYQFSGKRYGLIAAQPSTVAMQDLTGFYGLGTLSFGHAGVRLGYASETDKVVPALGSSPTVKTMVLGGWYSLAQNVELDLEYNSAKTSGGVVGTVAATSNTTTLVLEYVY
ncbi:MAG: hypothetical protein Q9M28_05235 [Mariprofundaceae bacterium]|nr:hypothetical protein [Mariprofundaceae bacterium]